MIQEKEFTKSAHYKWSDTGYFEHEALVSCILSTESRDNHGTTFLVKDSTHIPHAPVYIGHNKNDEPLGYLVDVWGTGKTLYGTLHIRRWFAECIHELTELSYFHGLSVGWNLEKARNIAEPGESPVYVGACVSEVSFVLPGGTPSNHGARILHSRLILSSAYITTLRARMKHTYAELKTGALDYHRRMKWIRRLTDETLTDYKTDIDDYMYFFSKGIPTQRCKKPCNRPTCGNTNGGACRVLLSCVPDGNGGVICTNFNK